jgi:hypothetical protein
MFIICLSTVHQHSLDTASCYQFASPCRQLPVVDPIEAHLFKNKCQLILNIRSKNSPFRLGSVEGGGVCFRPFKRTGKNQ